MKLAEKELLAAANPQHLFLHMHNCLKATSASQN